MAQEKCSQHDADYDLHSFVHVLSTASEPWTFAKYSRAEITGYASVQVTGLFVLRPGHVHRAIHSLCTHAVGNFHSRRRVMHRKPTGHFFRR